MSVSVVGLIPWYEALNELEVIDKIEKIIQDLPSAKKQGFVDKSNKNPTVKLTPRVKMFTICFTLEGYIRVLTVHFNCHCDYNEILEGKKVILSVNDWGNWKEFMYPILKEFPGSYLFIDSNPEETLVKF